ncbi:MAG: helix-turn-helix transcriptional regulator [Treponema sp.]|nr:helix-turn-helix transcriptional regulator [Treponema sp.]MBD5428358.1 helix-turn-helix transcriptional regulator [Treponema sp.]
MNVKVIFGENLKHCRKLHKLTQEELAERLGITPPHLSRIENGKSFVTAELLDALCVIFDITPASLFLSPQEFTGDDSLFAKIDAVIDEELKEWGIQLKKKIRKQ